MDERIERKSVKVELSADHINDMSPGEVVDEVFWDALTLLGDEDSVMDRFFTVRFDENTQGGVSATISSSRKR